ncbi:hypothetical protein ACFOZ0_03085 [Streptomyces yaanensis]|uniref:Uncharacterized protein n=1 Tax=Streptomyces yaanensis TaxID=1142239 RepID=A0ABV7S935_9ACTN|nr:hypothetical protein [Streptomyces sp. CGMCC 4.7035]WNB99861.1 hypothetical protein Q2K21_18305 [Streptomyces sp. CGMCC 4.7035]
MNSPLPHTPQVEVVVSDCSAADAGSLFAELCRRFGSDRATDEAPHEAASGRPTMWTGTFDTSAAPGPSRRTAPSPHLSGPVTAELQGEPRAVERLRRALDETFVVHQLGVVAGDQEVDVELRLESRKPA